MEDDAGTRAGTRTSREWRTPDAAATRRLGQALGRAARERAPRGIVIALRGELGAGKTVLVQGIARGFGVRRDDVVSPTFQVARSYPAEGAGGGPAGGLHHVDAYRLRDAGDLEAAGFEDMWGPGRLTCVEWADRVEDALPVERLDVRIEVEPPPGAPPGAPPPEAAPRRIVATACGADAVAVLAAAASEAP